MADCIIAGTGGGGVSSDELTARAAQVLAGRSYVGADTGDEAGMGTMPNIGSVQRTLHAGESMAIPQGYHDGTGAVAAASLAEQTPGTAAARDILAGKSAWVDGRRVDGSIPVIDTMGNGDGRGNHSQWFGLDGNNRTFWVELPHRAAYYTRSDGKPHVTIEAAALGNVIKEQVLQGARFSCAYGINVEGTIPTWHASGDIGGQRVIDAFQNTAFAGDYGAKGRGVFMRILGGVYTEPGTMWCFAPANTILPHNIREGVPILGTIGTMKDYSSTCVPFDGAHFDGVHLSGWASGTLSRQYVRYNLNSKKDFDSGYNRKFQNWDVWWGFTPSVHTGAFRTVRITVHTYTDGWVYDNSVAGGKGKILLEMHLVRPSGEEHKRDFSPILSARIDWVPVMSNAVADEWHTVEVNAADLNEQAFLVLHLHTDVIRPQGQANGYNFRAELARVELIT
jgi:putative uncharacterized protein (fragment)